MEIKFKDKDDCLCALGNCCDAVEFCGLVAADNDQLKSKFMPPVLIQVSEILNAAVDYLDTQRIKEERKISHE